MSGSISPRPGVLLAARRDDRLGPILACAALLAILGAQMLIPVDDFSPPAAMLSARRAKPIVVPPPVADAESLARPIFAPDRRPGRVEGVGQDAPLAGFAALGTATGRGVAVAVISGPSGKTNELRLRDELEGWRVVGIDRSRVTFERNGLRTSLVVGAPATAVTR